MNKLPGNSDAPSNASRRALFSRMRNKAEQAVQEEKLKQRTPRTVPRPPCAVDEALFVEMCDGCGDCAPVCPTEAIFISQGKAELDLELSHCNHCGECIRACKSNALLKTEPSRIDAMPAFTASCNNYLLTPCRACATACPENAITIAREQMPVVDNARCTGCGQCRGACYIGAVVMETGPGS